LEHLENNSTLKESIQTAFRYVRFKCYVSIFLKDSL
jgi:hypothetical protein